MITVKGPLRYEYLPTGWSRSGRRFTEIVQASSADEAIQLFEERARSDIG